MHIEYIYWVDGEAINLQVKKLVARRHVEDYVAFYYRVRNLNETIALLLIAIRGEWARVAQAAPPFE